MVSTSLSGLNNRAEVLHRLEPVILSSPSIFGIEHLGRKAGDYVALSHRRTEPRRGAPPLVYSRISGWAPSAWGKRTVRSRAEPSRSFFVHRFWAIDRL